MCKRESVSKLEMAIQLLQESTVDVINDSSQLRLKLSNCDLELSDLDHYLEFATLSTREACTLITERKELLVRRREIKDQLRMIKALEQMINDRESQIKSLSKITKKIVEVEKSNSNQSYKPRIRADLFEALRARGVKC